jgi:rhamnogalacturonan endolyase
VIARRDFHRLGAASAVGAVSGGIGGVASAAGAARPRAGADPGPGGPTCEVIETETEIVVDNGPVRITVSKTSASRLTSLKLHGQELLGVGGRGNYDMNNAQEGDPLPLPPAANTYEILRGEDFVDIAFRYSPTNGGPFWLERHHVIRAGEPGIHLATVFRHPPELHGFRSDQHRYVFYLDPELFTEVSVEDDPIGDAWRAGAARMPTPAELTAAPMIMDATHDLTGLGSAYPRRYYTKYDWATYVKDHVVHGLYGNGYGIWAVQPNREAFNGGPVRQDLTLHQTTSRPVLLVEPQATHYGSPPVRVAAGQTWEKTYGPYFVHLSQGDDPARMRAEALRYARFDAHREFYDRLALPGWMPTARRSTVTGRVRVPGQPHLDGAVAVLSDNRLDFQRTALGYTYWADVNPVGGFRLGDVRPGTYRLTVYRPGMWDEFVRDDVVVPEGGRVDLGHLHWRPVQHGRTVFQLGTPDRTSAEFRRGTEFRQWGTSRFFPADFPGGVVYTVGRSGDHDWNYLQFQRIDGQPVAPWRIRFDLDRPVRPGATATLTIALAAWAMDTARDVPPLPSNLTIGVNDTRLVWTFEPDDARGATYRSACAGRHYRRAFRFDAGVLRRTGNEIVLAINEDTPPELGNEAAYDAIRLEIG